MEVEKPTSKGNAAFTVDPEVLTMIPGVPAEFWDEIELDEIKIADLEITMNKDEGNVKPDMTKPNVDSNGKAVSLRYVNNTIKIIRYLFNDSLIDEENDIKKDFYEGGFKIWECTVDLLKYLHESMLPYELKGKNVFDVGCGHGLLGIQAFLHGANSVYFQDFNLEVLKFAVIPNIYLNGMLEVLPRASFISGDWSKTYEKIINAIDDVVKEGTIGTPKATKFDLMLMSEVLYCKENYEKLARLITELLSETGFCLISTKLYYFGCTGSLPEFREYLANYWPNLAYKSVKQIKNKMSNKREIVAISLQKV
eukprot:CAMPEP_0176458344 /NCGR_PEP_ID=MMETSP0127-20121128/32546_1 /TAXON_ID=938130 /ORGANISM="Platyophrya macrostoma, Strain WH" /LENGTH=309 /DNA_ID=CAMNT_0017848913 /DNA_START=27 /DNA_END=956 /DNA_ORIENTATION=+